MKHLLLTTIAAVLVGCDRPGLTARLGLTCGNDHEHVTFFG